TTFHSPSSSWRIATSLAFGRLANALEYVSTMYSPAGALGSSVVCCASWSSRRWNAPSWAATFAPCCVHCSDVTACLNCDPAACQLSAYFASPISASQISAARCAACSRVGAASGSWAASGCGAVAPARIAARTRVPSERIMSRLPDWSLVCSIPRGTSRGTAAANVRAAGRSCQCGLGIRAPGRRRRRDRPGQVELGTEAAIRALPAQRVREQPVEHELDGPDVRRRGRQQRGRVGVRGKRLLRRAARVRRVAAVLSDLVLRAVGVAVVVLQAQTRAGARHHPRPRTVIADVER